MSASLRALLAGIIDYAGLFPPVRLPLETAIRNYARYRNEPESWMLGHFICPAARLAELSPFVEELFGTGPPLKVSALGQNSNTDAEFKHAMRADLDTIAAFNAQRPERACVDMIELRLPTELLHPTHFDELKTLLEPIWGGLPISGVRTAPQKTLRDFYETSLGQDWRATLAAVLPLIPGGFKLRCGGLEAAAFPSAEQVAGVLMACARWNKHFKATAGLHHPIRHFDTQLQTPVHGFLNVFGAGVLARAVRLGEDQVRRIIEDEDPGHFVFTDDAFHWKDLLVPIKTIVGARSWVTSFGSCSFDEPRDDLRALGLLS